MLEFTSEGEPLVVYRWTRRGSRPRSTFGITRAFTDGITLGGSWSGSSCAPKTVKTTTAYSSLIAPLGTLRSRHRSRLASEKPKGPQTASAMASGSQQLLIHGMPIS